MLPVTVLLLFAAFVVTLASTWNPAKVPLWVAVLLLVLVGLLQVLPR